MSHNRLPISVFIIAKNEALRIAQVIESVIDWVDEVIVIDSGSTDKTVEIAENLGCKVVYHAWQGYEVQKIYGESLCAHKWILNIDADEEVSPELAAEIQALFKNGNEPSKKAYRLKITVVHRFENRIRRFAPFNAPIRFYHRDFASFANKTQIHKTHDSVIINKERMNENEVVTLTKPVFHRSMLSIWQMVYKGNFVTTEQAEDLLSQGRNPSLIRLIFEPFLFFFKSFILRRHFIFGLHGFIDSVIYSFIRFLRLAKARELFDQQKFHK
ncbi:glycosyltransferase family 2 protein [Rickettsiales endosymbiont of Stachyamoeba lipophora]|uniref:glycosyltransferase family 2 protein n=1 Tax=Rickettsiales endosymbiont of Stachyamoeba lipophora TaxID=2486578 RepID=UPI000F65415E|nr:glycosyltransferase family 2 protein [Rickettsiales endosymbiont of Stachyamoeba lipophora]AZL15680.1 glycosyltransferase family 2 protein [Rickettsiales endosymbiont of Stachyamoeba lipophora]